MLWHCWLGDRKDVRPVKRWVLVCWWWRFDCSFACLIAPLVITTCVVLSCNKIISAYVSGKIKVLGESQELAVPHWSLFLSVKRGITEWSRSAGLVIVCSSQSAYMWNHKYDANVSVSFPGFIVLHLPRRVAGLSWSGWLLVYQDSWGSHV